MVEFRVGICSMNSFKEERQLSDGLRSVSFGIDWHYLLSGCIATSVPLASLPIRSSHATLLNSTGIDRYQSGYWMEAVESFDQALRIDPDFWRLHFNATRALRMPDQREEATRDFR